MNEQNIIKKPWRGIVSYRSSKNTGDINPTEMMSAIRGAGGSVTEAIAKANGKKTISVKISFHIPDDGYSGDKVREFADANGWKVRWL